MKTIFNQHEDYLVLFVNGGEVYAVLTKDGHFPRLEDLQYFERISKSSYYFDAVAIFESTRKPKDYITVAKVVKDGENLVAILTDKSTLILDFWDSVKLSVLFTCSETHEFGVPGRVMDRNMIGKLFGDHLKLLLSVSTELEQNIVKFYSVCLTYANVFDILYVSPEDIGEDKYENLKYYKDMEKIYGILRQWLPDEIRQYIIPENLGNEGYVKDLGNDICSTVLEKCEEFTNNLINENGGKIQYIKQARDEQPPEEIERFVISKDIITPLYDDKYSAKFYAHYDGENFWLYDSNTIGEFMDEISKELATIVAVEDIRDGMTFALEHTRNIGIFSLIPSTQKNLFQVQDTHGHEHKIISLVEYVYILESFMPAFNDRNDNLSKLYLNDLKKHENVYDIMKIAVSTGKFNINSILDDSAPANDYFYTWGDRDLLEDYVIDFIGDIDCDDVASKSLPEIMDSVGAIFPGGEIQVIARLLKHCVIMCGQNQVKTLMNMYLTHVENNNLDNTDDNGLYKQALLKYVGIEKIDEVNKLFHHDTGAFPTLGGFNFITDLIDFIKAK